MKSVKTKIGPVTFDHADYDAENDVLYLHVGLTILGAQHILDSDGELLVTIPKAVKASPAGLAPALAAI